MQRTNSEILKGSKLMVFLGEPGSTALGEPVGFATNHSISMTVNTTQISTKDHGDFPATLPQNVSWEVSCENLYSTQGEQIYAGYVNSMQPLKIVFSSASNYSNDEAEKGIIDNNEPNWTYTPNATATTDIPIAEGTAYLTSFTINAPGGDNATMSATFTGTGALEFKNLTV